MIQSKKDIMKKKLGMLKKAMDKKDCESESDVMEANGKDTEEETAEEEEEDPSSEKDLLAADKNGEDDDEREGLRKFMRGSKTEKKKGVVTVMIAAGKGPAKAPFKGKSKKA